MMSLSSRIDVKLTAARLCEPPKVPICRTKLRLRHAAEMRSVRPRREAADAPGADRDPDLLERAPVVGGSLVLQEPAAVPGLEGVVHLQAAPVGAPGIGPAAFVVVDAKPAPQPGWMIRLPPRPVLAPLPRPRELLEPLERVAGENTGVACRRTPVHHREPPPRAGAKALDMTTPACCGSRFGAPVSPCGCGRCDGRAGGGAGCGQSVSTAGASGG